MLGVGVVLEEHGRRLQLQVLVDADGLYGGGRYAWVVCAALVVVLLLLVVLVVVRREQAELGPRVPRGERVGGTVLHLVDLHGHAHAYRVGCCCCCGLVERMWVGAVLVRMREGMLVVVDTAAGAGVSVAVVVVRVVEPGVYQSLVVLVALLVLFQFVVAFPHVGLARLYGAREGVVAAPVLWQARRYYGHVGAVVVVVVGVEAAAVAVQKLVVGGILPGAVLAVVELEAQGGVAILEA